MKRKLTKRNKVKINKLIKEGRNNGLKLDIWMLLKKQISKTKSISRAKRRYGVKLDFEDAEFDRVLGWLSVPEEIKGINKRDYPIRIFTELNELPNNMQKRFSSYRW